MAHVLARIYGDGIATENSHFFPKFKDKFGV